jgi:hypothetical protein
VSLKQTQLSQDVGNTPCYFPSYPIKTENVVTVHYNHSFPISQLALISVRFPSFFHLSFWLKQNVNNDRYVALIEWYWKGKTEVLTERVSVPLRPPPISHGMTCPSKRSPLLKSQRCRKFDESLVKWRRNKLGTNKHETSNGDGILLSSRNNTVEITQPVRAQIQVTRAPTVTIRNHFFTDRSCSLKCSCLEIRKRDVTGQRH